jgi:uncharacterized protein
MSAENQHIEKDVGAAPEGTTNPNAGEGAPAAPMMSAEEHEIARAAARFGYGPLAQVNTAEARLPPFGGEFQPGLYRSVERRKFANPAPLGLSAFALTTFILSAINMGARDITEPNIVIGSAFGYGGLVQLLAGMWYVSRFFPPLMVCRALANGTREMAVGNTFGATALSSYGGFWLSFAIVLTPGGFEIQTTLAEKGGMAMWYNSFGLYLMVSNINHFTYLSEPQLTKPGLVHFHHHPALLHPALHCRLLPPVPLP